MDDGRPRQPRLHQAPAATIVDNGAGNGLISADRREQGSLRSEMEPLVFPGVTPESRPGTSSTPPAPVTLPSQVPEPCSFRLPVARGPGRRASAPRPRGEPMTGPGGQRLQGGHPVPARGHLRQIEGQLADHHLSHLGRQPARQAGSWRPRFPARSCRVSWIQAWASSRFSTSWMVARDQTTIPYRHTMPENDAAGGRWGPNVPAAGPGTWSWTSPGPAGRYGSARWWVGFNHGVLQKIGGLPRVQRSAGIAGVDHGRSLANIQAVRI